MVELYWAGPVTDAVGSNESGALGSVTRAAWRTLDGTWLRSENVILRKMIDQVHEWRKKNKEHLRRYNRRRTLKRHFGITVDQYNDMLEAQRGVCAICCGPEKMKRNGKVKNLAVDHDENTGKIRALLCGNCNTAIGSLLHSPELCRAAARYLGEHS